jgi:proteasome activator subunit 3 (PA28 gamma)
VPCNPKLSTMVAYLKPEIIGLVDKCSVLKTWIQMMVPKIEDGNNFGVGIQEDVLSEVGKSEADAGSYLEQLSRYYTSRAKILSKCAKYPFLDDYQRAVDEYDQKVFISFKLILRELRNIYIVVYDVILKNYEKIVHPRSENTASLY